MLFNILKKNKAFTLIETLVGVAVFLVIATATYQAYISLFTFISLNQYKVLALNLANEQFEIIRNLSYLNVGIPSGIPKGLIPHIQTINRGGISFTVTTTIRNIDLPNDGTIGGNPNDISPADNKFVNIEIDCSTCKNFKPLNISTTVAPKNLETASSNGALLIKVFDANGVPVSNASVHIANNLVSPSIIIDDVTDNDGLLQIVDVPPGVESYEITVTKSGYSTDKTYATGAIGNPNPTKAHATVLIQQLTQISFSIDKLSSISFTSVTPSCVAINNFDFSLTGSRLIGENVPKYFSNKVTDGAGKLTLNNMEWDYYSVAGIDTVNDIVGVNPLNSINLNPDSNQNVLIITEAKNPKSLLVTIKDGSTQLPITDATVTISKDDYSSIKITGRGFMNQTDWSGSLYTYNDGNIETENPSGDLQLLNVFGNYNSNGILESTTIDTGSISNFYNFVWSPTDQPVLAGINSVKFQIATNEIINATTTWEYRGPDGATTTYYTSTNSPIDSIHNGDRYLRYKLFLHTEDSTVTPNISDVSFTVTSSCTPPGQVIFSGLSSGTYHINVQKTGYNTVEIDKDISSDWQEQEIILSP